jgi:hypothetical protein
MDLEILNIPCLYPAEERRSQRFVFGAPHFAFNPLHFQRLWYHTHHNALVPEEVMDIMQRMQEIAKGSQITLGQLLQYAMDEPDIEEEGQDEPRFSEENIVDMARLIAQKHASEYADMEEELVEEPVEHNPLARNFAKAAKEKVVAFALQQIGAQGRTGAVLEFLLMLEQKDVVQILREIDREDTAGLTYKLCLYADCYGEEQDVATLHQLDAILHLPYAEQVRCVLELFGLLEQWVLRDSLPPRIPYDLSELHAALADFIVPLQNDGERKSQLKALQKLQQQAEAGDAAAQAKWQAALEISPAAL